MSHTHSAAEANNGQMSLHFRGPLKLSKFAVYTPGSKTKRDATDSVAERRHAHNHNHNHARKHARYQHSHLHSERETPHKVEERAEHPTIWVTATINGAVVSWTNDYWGPEDPATPAPAASTQAPAPPSANTPASTPAPAVSADAGPTAIAGVQGAAYVQPTATAAATNTKPSSNPASGGDYVRSAFYDAASGTASGLVFLANYGGQGSGAWTPTFGNTLSYVDSTGTKGASSPQTLGNVTLPSSHEIAIYSDRPCDAASCGYWQPGSVAYQGFGPGDKAFLLELQMPHEAGAGGAQGDMPAFWGMNSKIARQQQYGSCSCWSGDAPGQGGCGEFDFLEVLAPGDDKCKSTVHAINSGGDSNYFVRPADKAVKVAVVFDSASRSVSVKVLDDATVIGDSLSAEDITGFLSTENAAASGGKGASLFAIAS